MAGRGGSLFGRGGASAPVRTDETAESLERHNDTAIINLHSQVKEAGNIARGIRTAVEGQNDALRGIGDQMGSLRDGIGASSNRLTALNAQSSQKNTLYIVVAVCLVFIALYKLFKG